MTSSSPSTSRKTRRGLLAKTAVLVAATAIGNGDVARASSSSASAGKNVRDLDDREKRDLRRLSAVLQRVDRESAWSEDSRDILESLQTRDDERHRKLLQEREAFAESEKMRIRESRRLQERNDGGIADRDWVSGGHETKHARTGLPRRTIRVSGKDGRFEPSERLPPPPPQQQQQQQQRDLSSTGGKALRQRTWTSPRGRGFRTNRQPAAGRSRGYYYGDVDDFFVDDYFYGEGTEDASRHWVLPPGTDLDPNTIICIEDGQRKLVRSRHWFYPGDVDYQDNDDYGYDYDDNDDGDYGVQYTYAVGGKAGKSMKSGKSANGGYYVYGGGVGGGTGTGTGGGNGLIYLDYDHDDAIYYVDQPQTVVVGGKTGKQNKGGKLSKVLACSEVIIPNNDDDNHTGPPSRGPPSGKPPSGNPPSVKPPSGNPPPSGPPSGPTAPTPNMSPVPTPVDFVSGMPTLDCPEGCPDCDPNSPLPCPPPEMKAVCDKHNDELYPPGDAREGERIANFRDCYDMCKPSFCCIHDSLSKEYAPSCAQEYENCFLYYPCYIIWWKLHDTIGPATFLRVEQDEDFYNVDFEFLTKDFQNDQEFFQQLFGHHFDDDTAPTDDTFENENNW
ncbi:hypothetical protein ACHAXS_011163 [Conticribra weissflogii]